MFQQTPNDENKTLGEAILAENADETGSAPVQNSEASEVISLPKNTIVVIKRLLSDLIGELEALRRLLPLDNENYKPPRIVKLNDGAEPISSGSRLVEGVFDGMQMVGSDGQIYAIPANYASKSKLVEGDLLKLTITPAGSFVFKQIGPIERSRLVGELIKRNDEDNQFDVLAGGKIYHVLTASVTYFKGEEGDGAVIMVPKNSPSRWAAIENIIKK